MNPILTDCVGSTCTPNLGFFWALWGIIMVLIAWSIFWKAFALWYSARNNDKIWFIIFLLINLLGIPEIIYLHMKTDFFKKVKKTLKSKKK